MDWPSCGSAELTGLVTPGGHVEDDPLDHGVEHRDAGRVAWSLCGTPKRLSRLVLPSVTDTVNECGLRVIVVDVVRGEGEPAGGLVDGEPAGIGIPRRRIHLGRTRDRVGQGVALGVGGARMPVTVCPS